MHDERKQGVVVISGGTAGIGLATAHRFAQDGWTVAVGSRREDRVQQAVREIKDRGGKALGSVLDICDPHSIGAFYDAVEKEVGPASIVLGCAAHACPGTVAERTPESIISEIQTSLTGAVLFAQRGLQTMLREKLKGDLLFISSTSATVPWPLLLPYASAKAGLEHAAKTLAYELEGKGVRSTFIRIGNTLGTEWSATWSESHIKTAVGEWVRFGLTRHGGMLTVEQVAEGILSVVKTPRGVHIDQIAIHPEAPETQ